MVFHSYVCCWALCFKPIVFAPQGPPGDRPKMPLTVQPEPQGLVETFQRDLLGTKFRGNSPCDCFKMGKSWEKSGMSPKKTYGKWLMIFMIHVMIYTY